MRQRTPSQAIPASWLCWHRGAPRRRTVRLPVAQQTGKRRAAVALFLPQFTSFPAGQQIGGPALAAAISPCSQARYRRANSGRSTVKKAFRHLASLPALEGRDVRHPAGFHSPLQPPGTSCNPPTGRLLLASCISRRRCSAVDMLVAVSVVVMMSM